MFLNTKKVFKIWKRERLPCITLVSLFKIISQYPSLFSELSVHFYISFQASQLLSERNAYGTHSKHSRKTRECKSRNQEWPEVPQIDKIEEQNPEILAMKILESGRQIEANKLKSVDHKRESGRSSVKFERNYPGSASKGSPYTPSSSANTSITNATHSSSEGDLKVLYRIEDRIGNIITTALNEDTKTPSYPRCNNESWPPATKTNSNSATNSYVNGDFPNLSGASAELNNKTNLPDYTQVSPAKLALRRHLSQEKIGPQQSRNFIGTRTIGDLVSGEIERTLEISNQSIINTVVPMCLGANSSSIPKNEFTEALIQKSLAESFHNSNNSNRGNSIRNDSHRKSSNVTSHNSQYGNSKNARSSVLYSTSSQSAAYSSSKYVSPHSSHTEMKQNSEYSAELKSAKEEPVEGYVSFVI